jgi:hypothetical protein
MKKRDELLERLLWLVDGYRFKYLDRTEMISRLIRLIDDNPEAVKDE